MSFTAGDRVGAYKLIAPLGKGGMGAVWRAVREEEGFEQPVAIKFVHEGLSDNLLDRFRRERQILAQLNHPNIARILDGGTVDGLPYLVMELIEGRPLVAYADQQQLGLDDRVRLFRMVCEAVQYAHQRLVVHRDLKPANILVTADGAPKLLDFGIAKILAEDDPDRAATQTLTGFMMMTPDYASPEQVRGEPVSTATDVYSLGAILYELLSGHRPHGLSSYDAAELVERICNTDTVAPSKRGKPALRGDLDTIILKAMQKDPARRYGSADQLSEDLRRYLTGLPVLARPDTLRYRMAKYARRHTWGLTSAAAVVLALIAGLLVAAGQARIASERFEMVRTLANKFVFDVHDEIARIEGTTKARQLVVATGLQYLDRLSQSAGSDRVLLEDLAKAYGRIGDVQGRVGSPNLGQLAAATASYQKAVDMADRLYRKDAAKYSYTLCVAHSNLATNLLNREQDEEARKHLERSIELAREDEKRDPRAERTQIMLASNEKTLGTLYYGQVKVREALREYDSSEQRWEHIAAANPNTQNRLSSASAAEDLARVKQLFGEVDASRNLLERARLIVEDELARSPDDPRQLRRASLLYQFLDGAYLIEGRPSLDDAEESWRWRQKSSAITARLTAKDPDNADAKDLRSADYVGSGFDLAVLGRAREAAPLLEVGLALTRELKKATPGVDYFDSREAFALRWLAYARSGLKQHDAARKTAVEAVATAERDWKSDPSSAPGQMFLVTAWRVKAQVEIAARDFAAARASLDHAFAIAGKWPDLPQHEMYYAVGLANYYQSRLDLAHAEADSAAQRAWTEKLQALWRNWPEQNGYTRMRQSRPTARYPW
jgi:hypothetical protein